MNNQKLLIAAAASLAGLVVVGCFGGDPNKNSMIVFPPASGQGGATGTGNGGAGGGSTTLGPIVGTPLATYETTFLSFAFSNYMDKGDENLADPTRNTGTAPTLAWDGSDSSPTGGGSLMVTAPYSGASQYVDIQSPQFAAANMQNFMGGKLHVRVKVDAGSTFSGQIEPYVDTMGFIFVGTSITATKSNNWVDYVVDLNNAMTKNAGYDLTKVIIYGVHIGTGGGGAGATPVTFHIDSFSVEGGSPSVGGTGGSGGSTGGGGSGGGSGSDAATDSAATDGSAG